MMQLLMHPKAEHIFNILKLLFMKSRALIFLTFIILGMTFSSCSKDPFADIEFLNCDEGDCNDKSCATIVSLDSRIVCALDGSDDLDWYAVEVSQEEVDTNFGLYSFNFINLSDDLTFQVELFAEGAAAGNVSVPVDALIYEPDADSTGGMQFFEPGTYYFKVERASGQRGDGAYEIRLFL